MKITKNTILLIAMSAVVNCGYAIGEHLTFEYATPINNSNDCKITPKIENPSYILKNGVSNTCISQLANKTHASTFVLPAGSLSDAEYSKAKSRLVHAAIVQAKDKNVCLTGEVQSKDISAVVKNAKYVGLSPYTYEKLPIKYRQLYEQNGGNTEKCRAHITPQYVVHDGFYVGNSNN